MIVKADKTEAFAYGNGQKPFLRFAKPLEFTSINHRRDINEKRGIHDRMLCSGCKMDYKDEITLVRWYEVPDRENLLVHEIENALECGRLRWQ